MVMITATGGRAFSGAGTVVVPGAESTQLHAAPRVERRAAGAPAARQAEEADALSAVRQVNQRATARLRATVGQAHARLARIPRASAQYAAAWQAAHQADLRLIERTDPQRAALLEAKGAQLSAHAALKQAPGSATRRDAAVAADEALAQAQDPTHAAEVSAKRAQVQAHAVLTGDVDEILRHGASPAALKQENADRRVALAADDDLHATQSPQFAAEVQARRADAAVTQAQDRLAGAKTQGDRAAAAKTLQQARSAQGNANATLAAMRKGPQATFACEHRQLHAQVAANDRQAVTAYELRQSLLTDRSIPAAQRRIIAAKLTGDIESLGVQHDGSVRQDAGVTAEQKAWVAEEKAAMKTSRWGSLGSLAMDVGETALGGFLAIGGGALAETGFGLLGVAAGSPMATDGLQRGWRDFHSLLDGQKHDDLLKFGLEHTDMSERWIDGVDSGTQGLLMSADGIGGTTAAVGALLDGGKALKLSQTTTAVLTANNLATSGMLMSGHSGSGAFSIVPTLMNLTPLDRKQADIVQMVALPLLIAGGRGVGRLSDTWRATTSADMPSTAAFDDWETQSSKGYVERNYAGEMWDMDRQGLPHLLDKIRGRLPDSSTGTLLGADLGSGPVPTGVLILKGAGVDTQYALEYAKVHRNYLTEVFSSDSAKEAARPIWGKFADLLGVDWKTMQPEIGALDLKDTMPLRNRFDAVTCLTVAESCTDNAQDFHTALINGVDTLKPGGVAGFSFMAGSKDWTTGDGTKFPAAGVSHTQIEASVKAIDPTADVMLIPESADEAYEHSSHEGMTLAVFNKPLNFDRATVDAALAELRRGWPADDRGFEPSWPRPPVDTPGAVTDLSLPRQGD